MPRLAFSLRDVFWLTLVMALACGCHSEGKPIRIVLVNGFSGDIEIVKDSRNGTVPVWRDNAWEYKIPEEGKLACKDIRPFFQWHKEIMEYENGTQATVESLGTTAGDKGSRSSTEYDGTTMRWRVGK